MSTLVSLISNSLMHEAITMWGQGGNW